MRFKKFARLAKRFSASQSRNGSYGLVDLGQSEMNDSKSCIRSRCMVELYRC